MMNVEELRSYCLSLDADVVEKFPFTAFKYAKDVLVFYISGHMFCYFDINDLSNVTVKCAPESIPMLEDHYDWIGKPYNGNAKYWIGIDAYRADDETLKQLIRASYEIVKEDHKTKKTHNKRIRNEVRNGVPDTHRQDVAQGTDKGDCV